MPDKLLNALIYNGVNSDSSFKVQIPRTNFLITTRIKKYFTVHSSCEDSKWFAF